MSFDASAGYVPGATESRIAAFTQGFASGRLGHFDPTLRDAYTAAGRTPSFGPHSAGDPHDKAYDED